MKRHVHPGDCHARLILMEARKCDNRGGMT
jgi:hypothetical protein